MPRATGGLRHNLELEEVLVESIIGIELPPMKRPRGEWDNGYDDADPVGSLRRNSYQNTDN